jgi:hypothetical protein
MAAQLLSPGFHCEVGVSTLFFEEGKGRQKRYSKEVF